MCHSLETEGALHPNEGLTYSACLWRILSTENRKCYVWLTFPSPTPQSPQRQICTFLILINKINMRALAHVPLQISFQEEKKKRKKKNLWHSFLTNELLENIFAGWCFSELVRPPKMFGWNVQVQHGQFNFRFMFSKCSNVLKAKPKRSHDYITGQHLCENTVFLSLYFPLYFFFSIIVSILQEGFLSLA